MSDSPYTPPASLDRTVGMLDEHVDVVGVEHVRLIVHGSL
jgi:hypothetical protein